MNDLDNELSRTMRRHAENLSAAPLAFDDVRGKATSIRRRRQLAAGVGALAAVAVIVPTAMFAANTIKADNGLPAASQAPPTVSDSNSPAPTEGPTMGADSGALDVADLPTGAEPRWTLVTEGFAQASTEDATIRATSRGVVVETAGETFGPFPSSTGLARNAVANAVAWGTDDGNVMVWADGSSEPYTISTDFGETGVRVVAVTGTNCQEGTASDCSYYVTRYDMEANQQESVRMSGDGSVTAVDPDRAIIGVHDVSDSGLVLGLTSVDDTEPGSCSAVLDPASSGSTPLWETCKHTLDAFSPNGDYVLASDPYHSGSGSGVIAIYDAHTGKLLADRIKKADDMASYNSAVWEDETHVLFSAYQDGKWSIVRMNVDGAMEYALAPAKGGEDVPWHFETR
jgi:WD40 repeat protein